MSGAKQPKDFIYSPRFKHEWSVTVFYKNMRVQSIYSVCIELII